MRCCKMGITASCLLDYHRLYYTECQSMVGVYITIRMIGYGFLVALENFLKMQLKASDAGGFSSVVYSASAAKGQNVSKEYIFRKRLVALLPFYIMWHGKQRKARNEDAGKLGAAAGIQNPKLLCRGKERGGTGYGREGIAA